MQSEIVGAVKMRCYLSGMPELRLGLNDKILFESTGRKCTSVERLPKITEDYWKFNWLKNLTNCLITDGYEAFVLIINNSSEWKSVIWVLNYFLLQVARAKQWNLKMSNSTSVFVCPDLRMTAQFPSFHLMVNLNWCRIDSTLM